MIPDILINDTSMLKLGWIREIIDFPYRSRRQKPLPSPDEIRQSGLTRLLGWYLLNREPLH